MSTLANLYSDVKTLCQQWFYTKTEVDTALESLVDTIYPVGSIYMSVGNTSPSVLFGGTWQKIEDKFLLASGTTYANESTGGSADAVIVEHTHTQNPHNHTQDSHSHQPSTTTNRFVTSSESTASNYRVGTASSGRWVDAQTSSGTFFHQLYTDAKTPTINNETATNNETGESGTGKNMPPYLAVNVWKRTA